ncbi:MAG: hypothetical protein ACREGD_00270 [Candidatus Saccharimonadales bacterium]
MTYPGYVEKLGDLVSTTNEFAPGPHSRHALAMSDLVTKAVFRDQAQHTLVIGSSAPPAPEWPPLYKNAILIKPPLPIGAGRIIVANILRKQEELLERFSDADPAIRAGFVRFEPNPELVISPLR